MKRTILFTLIIVLAVFVAASSMYALESTSGTESGGRKPTPNPTKQAERQEKKEDLLANKKTKAYAEIDRRIEALNRLVEKINSIKRISADQKTLLVSQIQAEITSLNTLRVKIEGDTDLATLNSDKKSIVQAYRVFSFFIPKISVMAHANSIIELADLLTSKTTNPETLSKIAGAKTKASEALNSVLVLTADGYPENKGVLKDARETLRISLKELKEAKNSIVRQATGSAERKD